MRREPISNDKFSIYLFNTKDKKSTTVFFFSDICDISIIQANKGMMLVKASAGIYGWDIRLEYLTCIWEVRPV